jgi:ABC-type lipoprotein release transport system permease subunit
MKTLLLAWQCAKSDRVRTVLSILALTLGILGLVTVVAASAVLADTVRQRALMAGGDVATLRAEIVGGSKASEIDRYAELLRVRAGATRFATEIWLNDFEARSDSGDSQRVDVRMVSEKYRDIFPIVLTAGDWTFGKRTVAPRAALNASAGHMLGNTRFTLLSDDGSKLRVQVAGRLADGAASPRVYLPIIQGIADNYDSRTVYLDFSGPRLDRDRLEAASRELSSLGAQLSLGEIERIDTVSQLERELSTTSQVLLTLGALSIGSTLLGTINLGLAASKTRAREFALRRVLGASRRQIAMITLLESQIIALIAAVFAFALAWALFPVVIESFHVPEGISKPQFSPTIAALSFGVSAASALIASLAPALLSFRRDFSDVMRY